ncbi:flagellar assembly protein FliH [Siminovitchia acidinfaciens]|uniref:flagellar assembly protein FliH n=1 Tax=Siminovitchia acidinfaciens TaxID=2321395 RepID=UPI0013DF88DE|nr:flagellar assembly protein FliH [Siminovitchia acidinfaciens]
MSNIIKLHSDRILTGSKIIKPRIVETVESQEAAIDPLIEEKAQKIIKQAEERARQLIDRAVRETEQMKVAVQEEKDLWDTEKMKLSEEAWNEGYQNGLLEGRTEGKSEYKSLIVTARDTIQHAKSDFKTYILQAEQTILDLSIASTKTILGSVLSEEPEKFIGVVTKALNELKNEKEIEIYVHPSNFQLLVTSRKVLESIFPREVLFYIYPSEELNVHDCVIECETTRIDAGIDSQLTELKGRLAELLAVEQMK